MVDDSVFVFAGRKYCKHLTDKVLGVRLGLLRGKLRCSLRCTVQVDLGETLGMRQDKLASIYGAAVR